MNTIREKNRENPEPFTFLYRPTDYKPKLTYYNKLKSRIYAYYLSIPNFDFTNDPYEYLTWYI